MANLIEPNLLYLIDRAKLGETWASAELLRYAAKSLPAGDLHPRVAEWLSVALTHAVENPAKARNALGLAEKSGQKASTKEAVSIRNASICAWAEEDILKGVALESIARAFLLQLRPDSQEVDWGFVDRLHNGDLKQRATSTVLRAYVCDGSIGYTFEESKDVRAALTDAYKNLTGKTTVEGILAPYRDALNHKTI
ncbi:Uncharacterised protein [Halioglobus japonicus]|nr:Uncharacterised protein [Halioglobus japonicus]